MNISSTTRPQMPVRKLEVQNQNNETESTVDHMSAPEDLYDFKTNATMAGGMGLVGGVLGAIPGVGIFTNGCSNEHGASTLTKTTAVAASVANLVVSGLVLTGAAPTWTLAIPGVLGAATWAGYSVDTRNHC